MDVIKVGAIGVMGVILALQIKAGKPEYGFYIAFVVGLYLVSFSLSGVRGLMDAVTTLKEYADSGDGSFRILMKVIGITYICEFCSDICKDAGYGTVAGQIEIFGKLSVLAAGMPLLLAVMECIRAIGG